MHMYSLLWSYVGHCRGQRMALGHLDTKLWDFVDHLKYTGNKIGSSGSTTSTLNYWVISLDPLVTFIKKLIKISYAFFSYKYLPWYLILWVVVKMRYFYLSKTYIGSPHFVKINIICVTILWDWFCLYPTLWMSDQISQTYLQSSHS